MAKRRRFTPEFKAVSLLPRSLERSYPRRASTKNTVPSVVDFSELPKMCLSDSNPCLRGFSLSRPHKQR